MNYFEQSKWLIDNGFNEIPSSFHNLIIWEKKLELGRILNFSFHQHVYDWQLSIYGGFDEKFKTSIWLINSIPSDADFKQFQPLIDIIK